MKSLKHGIRILNAHINFTQGCLNAVKTCINNENFIKGLEQIELSIKETAEQHAEELNGLHKVLEATLRDQTVEEMEAEEEDKRKAYKEKMDSFYKDMDSFEEIFKDLRKGKTNQ